MDNEGGEAERALGIEYVVLVAGCISDNNSSVRIIGDTYRCDMGYPVGSRESTCKAGHPGSIPGWERSPGEGTHSNILAWKISWTEEPGGYSPWGLDESDTT